MRTANVMSINVMQIAASQYNDSTAFIAILQDNSLTDYLVNQPIAVNTIVPASKGDQRLLLPPTTGIQLSSLVYCNGLHTCSVVIGVTQNMDTPPVPFCSCPTHTSTDAILPAEGTILSTLVTIAPPLDLNLPVGSVVTFAVGTPSSISLPDTVNHADNGVPS